MYTYTVYDMRAGRSLYFADVLYIRYHVKTLQLVFICHYLSLHNIGARKSKKWFNTLFAHDSLKSIKELSIFEGEPKCGQSGYQ